MPFLKVSAPSEQNIDIDVLESERLMPPGFIAFVNEPVIKKKISEILKALSDTETESKSSEENVEQAESSAGSLEEHKELSEPYESIYFPEVHSDVNIFQEIPQKKDEDEGQNEGQKTELELNELDVTPEEVASSVAEQEEPVPATETEGEALENEKELESLSETEKLEAEPQLEAKEPEPKPAPELENLEKEEKEDEADSEQKPKEEFKLKYDVTSGERYVDSTSQKTEFDKMLDELETVSKDMLSWEVEKFTRQFTDKYQGDENNTPAEAKVKKFDAFLGGFITQAAMMLYDNGYQEVAFKRLEQAKNIIEARKKLDDEVLAIKTREEEDNDIVDLSDILGLFGDW